MNWYLNNREIIKNLSLNTATTKTPSFTNMCNTSEIKVDTDFETKDFYVFCDAIKRHLITGAEIGFDTTVKLDINNVATQTILSKVHTLLKDGEVAQFNNQTIQFDLLSGVSESVLEYTRYQAPCTLIFSDLGGNAEDEGEFSLEIKIDGKSTVVSN